MNITQSQIFVLDQDQALEFYVGVLGLEVAVDQDLGFMRWLTVRAGGGHQILLEVPGPPAMDPATAQTVRELVSKGASGGWLCLSTDDAHREFARLKAAEVDITDEPTEKPYGIDFGIRDPFGNAIRIGQLW